MAMFPCSNNPDPTSKQNHFYNGNELEYTLTHDLFSSPKQQVEIEKSTTPSMVKKLNHNANERNRRQKINTCIYTLRSLLPWEHLDQTKKMSMQLIITRVLEYIPKLQKQVEELTKRKEELLLKISEQENAVMKESQRKITSYYNSDFVVSTNKLNDNEVAVHISSHEYNKTMLSEILICLENNGLFLLNASSSKTFGERLFYNLHFKVWENQMLEPNILIKKLLSIYEKKLSNKQTTETEKQFLNCLLEL